MRIYQSGSVEVQALQGLDLVVDSGEMVAVVGASGSGKSTLLSILAGIDAPTAGRARVDRWDLLAMSRRRPGALPAAHRRLRPAADGEQPRAVPDRPADGRPADDGGPHAGRAPARAAPPSCWTLSASPTAPTGVRRSCPAGSRCGSPSRSPWPTSRACCSPTSRPASWTPPPPAEVFGALRDGQPRVRRHRRGGDPRPGGQRPGRADGRDPRRAHQQRGAAPHRHRRRRRHARDRRGVRGDGPGRPGPGAPRLPRGARADPAGPAGAGGRPRRDPPRRHRRAAGQ